MVAIGVVGAGGSTLATESAAVGAASSNAGLRAGPPSAATSPSTRHWVHTRFGTTTPTTRGESLKRAVARQRSRFGSLGVVRLFYSGVPAPWRVIKAAVHKAPVSVSFKLPPSKVLSGRYDKALRSWFRTAPRNHRTFWTYFHEPEDNISSGQFTAAKYRAAWRHIGSIAKAAKSHRHAKLVATLVLMCWTANPHSHRHWRSYYAAGTVKLLGWDCYNSAARKGHYKRPRALFHRAIKVSKHAHLRWALTELGSTLARGDDGTRRARWLSKTSTFASRHHAVFVAYFDSDVGIDYRLLDRASIRAWAARSPG